jgi:TP901 family phage tail tape measure protein
VAGPTLGTIRGKIVIDYNGAGVAKADKDIKTLKSTGAGTQASLDRVGRSMAIAGGLIAGGFAVAANAATKFEKQLSAIKAVSGATQSEMEAVRKKSLQLGADTAFSASESAQAIEELIKAGLTVSQVLDGAADATVALAAAGGIALPDAATIAANAMNSFNLQAKDLVKVADLIAGAANASAIDVGQFGQSLQQVGAVAHLAGLSFADTAVAIAEMGNAGIKGSDAGTSLKTFLQNLIPTTKQQIELSKKLGLITKNGTNAFFDQTGKVKSLSQVSQVLQNALKGQTKEQQLLTLQTLFGSDAIRAAAVLADNGAAGFDKLAASMGKVTAADVAATRLDNLSGQLEQLKGSAETLAIQIGTKLIPILTKFVKNLTQLANWFSQLSSKQQNWIIGVAATIATLLLLASALIKIVAFVRAFIVAIQALRVAWIALNTSFLASPIGLIVIAIIALIAVFVILWLKFAGFRNFFINAWNHIWSLLKAIGSWFAGPFTNFFVGIWNVIFPIFKKIGDIVVAVFKFIVGGVLFYWNIIKRVLAFFAPLFKAAFDLIVSIVKLAFSIISAIIAVGVAIWRATIEPALKGLLIVIKFVIDQIVALWNAGWSNLLAIIRAVWTFIGPFVIGAVTIIGSAISAFVNFVVGVWRGAWSIVSGIVSGAWNFIVGIVSGAVNRVVAVINGIKAMVDRVKAFFDQLKNAANGGVGSLLAFVGGIPGRILSALGNVGKILFDAGRNIIQGLINGILSMVGKVKDAVGNVLSAARRLLPFSPAKEGPFSGHGWTTFSGRSLVEGMAEGILGARSTLHRALATTLAGAITPMALAAGSGALGASSGAAAPVVNVPAAQVVVVADLGDGVRRVVKSTIVDSPAEVAAANAKGSQGRSFVTGR